MAAEHAPRPGIPEPMSFGGRPVHHTRELLASLLTMAWVVEARDPYTGGHLWRVSRYAQLLASAARFAAAAVARVAVGGFLHDLGKVGVPDAILRKPAALTPVERAVLETHPRQGLRMLAAHPLASYVHDVVGAHHERMDGTGYPAGVAGDAIPLDARIVALADAFDAMTSARPYRPGLARDVALERIATGSGRQFDPDLAATFLRIGHEGAVDDVLGHSDAGIPLHECALCGNAVVVPRSAADGSFAYCRHCRAQFTVIRDGRDGRVRLAFTGQRGSAAALVAEPDEDLIARVVDESVTALAAIAP